MTDRDGDGGPTPDADSPTPEPTPIPLTRVATIGSGVARRASLGTIRGGLLRRPAALLVAFGVFLALPLASGIAWPGAVLQALVGTIVVLLLSIGFAWLRIRRWYPAGSTWRGGIDAEGLRVTFPEHDLTLPARAIRGVQPLGDLVMLTVGPRALQVAVPSELFTLPELHALMDRGRQSPDDSTAAGKPVAVAGPGVDGNARAVPQEIPRREAVVTPELARSMPRTLAMLEMRRPLSVVLLLFAASQLYVAIAQGQVLSLAIAALVVIVWASLTFAPYVQGRRLYPPGRMIGAGLRDGRLSVSLADRVVEHDVSSVRAVLPVREGVVVRLANGGVLLLPSGLLTDTELAELASRGTRRAPGAGAGRA